MDTIFARTVTHLAQWSQHPGTRDHARQRLRELAADQSGLWLGVVEAVRAELGRDKGSESGGRSLTKPG